MIVEIRVPSPGESISDVEIASWLVEDGEYVEKDQEIAEVESDKATLPLIAEQAGEIKILAGTGETIKVGNVVCSIDTSAKPPAGRKEAVASSAETDAKAASPAETQKESVAADKKPETAPSGTTGTAKLSDDKKGAVPAGIDTGGKETDGPDIPESTDHVKESLQVLRKLFG